MDVGLLCAIYDKTENMIYLLWNRLQPLSSLSSLMSQQLLTRGAQSSPR